MVLVEQRRSPMRAEPSATSRQIDTNGRPQRRVGAKPQHSPVPVGVLGSIDFRRCPRGFTLAKHAGKVFWIRARPGICEIRNAEELARALATNCWYARRKNKAAGEASAPIASSDSDASGNR